MITGNRTDARDAVPLESHEGIRWEYLRFIAVWLTLTRFVLTPVVVYLLFCGNHALSLVVFLAAALTDILDGRAARVLDQISDLGGALDPIADKILIGATLGSFTYLGVLPIWPLAAIAGIQVLRWLVGGLIYFRKKRRVLHATIEGKITDWLFIAGVVALYLEIPYSILAVAPGILFYCYATYALSLRMFADLKLQ